ncbi:hypothetical protein M2158_000669 [Streptomyces sp. SAI-144]|nr:hypothetical protein [Streptomyces sp. SAI-144]
MADISAAAGVARGGHGSLGTARGETADAP